MPTRLIREGILDSEKVNSLGWGAEVFYRRLMSKVDDFGLFDARPLVLRSALYPISTDRVSEVDITAWLQECVDKGLVILYQHGDKVLTQMLNTGWKTRSKPKFPPPDNTCKQLQTVVNTCSPIRIRSRSRIRSRISDSDSTTTTPIASASRADSSRNAEFEAVFAALWIRYPTKTEKKDARTACIEALRSGTDPADVDAGLTRYLNFVAARQGSDFQDLKHQGGGRWFKRRGWEDEYEVAHSQAPKPERRTGVMSHMPEPPEASDIY